MAYSQYGYNPGYPMGYSQPMPDQLSQLRSQQQYPPQMQYQSMQQPQHSSSAPIWVQGEAGAKSYLVAPGNSVILMDSENSVFYLKTTEPNGMPQPLRIFEYVETNMPGHPGGQKNDPGFMQMFGKLNEFRRNFHGDPEQMVMSALKEGRITQDQLDQVQSRATQIQNMLRSMGL